jgi:L-lactate dehydrogenase complex protein LldE
MRVTLFVPCYVDQFRPQAAVATVRVLRALELDVVYPAAQTCCGQAAFNAGHRAAARKVAAHFVDVFADSEAIVAPSGSCVAMVREHYPDLLAGHPCEADALALGERIFELSQFLVDVLHVERLGARLKARLALHDACHSLRALGVREQPRRLLAHVRDLEIVETPDAEVCCGFGGAFATKYSAISTAMADDKIDAALAANADGIVSCDPSCLMHLAGRIARRRVSLTTWHLAEVLAGGRVMP